MPRDMDGIKGFCDRFLSEHRVAILFLLFLVAVFGVAVGYKYLSYTTDDPRFCSTCHMMTETIKSWRKGTHWNITCQTCHKMNIFEKNRLLIAYVTKGPKSPPKQGHGRLVPWAACKGCHIDDVKQGASLRRSYGHAKHVFMENLGCENCHLDESHDFIPKGRVCSRCHLRKLVHGLGMEGLSCLNCHSYGDKSPKFVSEKRCLKCHKGMPGKGPMLHLKCFDCHKPHVKIKPTGKDCLGECHGNEAKVGQHGVHMEKARLGCLDCHKAHGWVVGKEQSKGLCDRCHQLKDPATFIY